MNVKNKNEKVNVNTKKNDVACRLRSLRAEHYLSQSVVANKLGISQQSYSKYENGTANMDSEALVKLCELYGVSSDYILGIKETNAKSKNVKVNYEVNEEEIKAIVEKVLAEREEK